jgi:aspartate kinase
MTFWGAKVLHYRSVELAHLLNITLIVELSHGSQDAAKSEARRTLINGEGPMYEQARILSVNVHKDVRWVIVNKSDLTEAMQSFSHLLKGNNLPLPQLLDSEKRGETWAFLITAPQETLNAIGQYLELSTGMSYVSGEFASVTATCQGSFASPIPEEIATALNRHSINVHKLLFSAMSVTAVIDAKYRDKAVQVLHDLYPAGA